MTTDRILKNTLDQLNNHNGNGNAFDTLCRLLYKSIYTQNPDSPNELGIQKEKIESQEQKRTVGDLYLLKESMPGKHYKNSPYPNGRDNPIIIVKYHGQERLIDGSNRINYWFGQGDLSKKLNVNFHEIEENQH